ncbi:hypothetical protein PIB30_095093 [Stylosanthes scabra]|uniref:Uncharacterized protein n=1 Tax=Stylosanthes scabra TaxID=79078 RepID=A0ABU6RW67_9FABA|nr:hypothetical protein [Stylosanthes scabra]
MDPNVVTVVEACCNGTGDRTTSDLSGKARLASEKQKKEPPVVYPHRAVVAPTHAHRPLHHHHPNLNLIASHHHHSPSVSLILPLFSQPPVVRPHCVVVSPAPIS